MTIKADLGFINIAPEVLADIAGYAAMSCFGVKGMTIRSVSDGIAHLLRRENMSRGVRITEAEDEPEVPQRAEAGLTGWVDCYPKSRLAATLFCGGVDGPRAIAGNGKLREAYELGKKV